MAHVSIRTPDPNINSAFLRLDKFLQTFKLPLDDPKVWTAGVPGYGIDPRCAKINDTRDNRWLVWAARYCEPDDDYLDLAAPAIIDKAFTPEGVEVHEHASPGADDFHHHWVWWLLQAALGYEYTGDTSLDPARIRKIIDKFYEMYDSEGIGMPHTGRSWFITSIGEPLNSNRGRAYGFFSNCNLAYSFRMFAHLSRTRGDQENAEYFDDRLRTMEKHIRDFATFEGYHYALKVVDTGEYRYRFCGDESLTLMTDNVFFPLAFGILAEDEMRASVEYLMPTLTKAFPVQYAVPNYRGEGGIGWWIPRSWQECLAHYCLGLRKMENCGPVFNAIKRLSDRFEKDDEVWENYDPETGSHKDYFVPARKGYDTTSACLNIAIIESLFGLRAETPGFASVSIRPSFPEDWTFAEIDVTVNRRRFHIRMEADRNKIVYDFTGSDPVPAHLVLPLPISWEGRTIRTSVDAQIRTLRGENRPCLEAQLPLAGSLVIEA